MATNEVIVNDIDVSYVLIVENILAKEEIARFYNFSKGICCRCAKMGLYVEIG